jgi:hypothetical protein
MKRALALAMMALAAPAAAQRGPFTYNCTAPFWDESGLWQMNAGPLRRASARIMISRLDDIPAEWPPNQELRFIGPVPDERGATMELSSAQDNIRVRVGVGPHERSDDRLIIWVSWQIDDEVDGRTLATVPRRFGRLGEISFAILNEGGRVIVEAGGARADVPVALGPDIEFRASCQGGEFMFYALDWGD